MNQKRERASVDAEASFEGLFDLRSVPPPASGPQDVHFARTAVGPMPKAVLEEIQRAKDEAQRVESLALPGPRSEPPSGARFADELPTRPGKDKSPAIIERTSGIAEAGTFTGEAIEAWAAEGAPPRAASLPSIPSIWVHVEVPAPRRRWQRIVLGLLAFVLLACGGVAVCRYALRKRRR